MHQKGIQNCLTGTSGPLGTKMKKSTLQESTKKKTKSVPKKLPRKPSKWRVFPRIGLLLAPFGDLLSRCCHRGALMPQSARHYHKIHGTCTSFVYTPNFPSVILVFCVCALSVAFGVCRICCVSGPSLSRRAITSRSAWGNARTIARRCLRFVSPSAQPLPKKNLSIPSSTGKTDNTFHRKSSHPSEVAKPIACAALISTSSARQRLTQKPRLLLGLFLCRLLRKFLPAFFRERFRTIPHQQI